MKAKRSLLILSLSLLLASCGGGQSSSSSASSSAGASSATTSQEATSQEGGQSTQQDTSSEPEAEQYVISVKVSSSVTLSLNKTKAAKGETIEITVVSVEEGVELVALFANGSKLSANSQGVYTFVMPNRAVTITSEVRINGDVVIEGQISAKLEEEVPGSGLFVARNVKVETTSGFSFNVFGKRLSMVDVDHTKCFADISYASSSDKRVAMSLAGGCTYDFYYDDNADVTAGRCYIKRVKVDAYPSDPSTLLSIFDGHSRSESTENPEGVIAVDYVNRATNINYQWNDYADGSLGIARRANDENTLVGVNYRRIDGDVYETADTYLEYSEHRVPGTPSNRASAKLGIVATTADIQQGYGRFATTAHDANFFAHHSGHATESIRYDLMESFFIGFESDPDIGTDGLGLNDRRITSVAEDSGFKVTIDSYREIDTTNVVSAAYNDVSYYKYDAELHFDDAGKFLSGTYLAKRYDDVAYSFATHTLLDPDTYTTIGDLNVTYTYGEALGVMNYDASGLFSSSITAEVHDEHVTDPTLQELNSIAVRGDTSSDTINEHMTLFSNLGEEDFLDVNNFTIIDYQNSDLVYPRSKSDPFTLLPRAEGKVNITVGNPMVESAPRYTFELNIEDAIKVRSFFLVGEDGQWSASQDQLDDAQSFTMPAGKVRRFQVWASVGDLKNVPFTPVSDDPDVKVERYVKDNIGYCLFDATEARIDAPKTVHVTLNSDRYLDGWGGPTVITVRLVPGSEFNPYGTWNLISSFDKSSEPWVATNVDKNYELNVVDYAVSQQPSTLTITKTSGATSVYSFGFHLNEDTGLASITRIEGGNVSEVYLAETVDGYLGVILYADDAQWTGMDEGSEATNVLGEIVRDEEGEVTEVYYDSFDLASNW